jgi:hypothetical protein
MAFRFDARWEPQVFGPHLRYVDGTPFNRHQKGKEWDGDASRFLLPDLLAGDPSSAVPFGLSYSQRLAQEISRCAPDIRWIEHELFWPDGSLAERRLAHLFKGEGSIPKLFSVESPLWPVQKNSNGTGSISPIDDRAVLAEKVHDVPIWQTGSGERLRGRFLSNTLGRHLADGAFSGLFLHEVAEERGGEITGPGLVLSDYIYSVGWPSGAVAEDFPKKKDRGNIKLTGVRADHRRSFLKHSDFEEAHRIDESTFPRTYIYGSSRRKFPHIMRGGVFLTVSDTGKDIIESLEPGIHQFISLEYRTKKGVHIANRWALNPLTMLDSLDREKSDPAPNELWHTVHGYSRRLYIDRKVVGGKHLWVERYHRGFFVSYQLASLFAQVDDDMLSFGRIPLN